jgi:Domain of unknown function (DUF4331)
MSILGRRLGAAAVAVLCSTIAATGLASDHLDSPAVSKDPTADITDLFAFTSPERAGHLVLVLNANPGASKDTRFSDAVMYSFRVRSDAKTSDREVRIDCSFDAAASQKGTCTAYAFAPSTQRLYAQLESGPFALNTVTDEQNGLRVFAGLRADPFYIDAKGAPAGIFGPKFAFTGSNSLHELDVLTIVIDLDVRRVLGSLGPSTTYRIAGETSIIKVKS